MSDLSRSFSKLEVQIARGEGVDLMGTINLRNQYSQVQGAVTDVDELVAQIEKVSGTDNVESGEARDLTDSILKDIKKLSDAVEKMLNRPKDIKKVKERWAKQMQELSNRLEKAEEPMG